MVGYKVLNVPIDKRTLTWDAELWHTYQGVRAALLIVWFLCAVTLT